MNWARDDELKIIDASEVNEKQVSWGNYYYTIIEEQLEALRKGKILYDLDEYGIFIRLKPKE